MNYRGVFIKLWKNSLLVLATSSLFTISQIATAQVMAQSDNSDIQKRVSRYFLGENPVSPADMPYWVKARSIFGRLGLGADIAVIDSSSQRIAGALKISESQANNLITAYRAAAPAPIDERQNSVNEMRQICSTHVKNGKVVDAMALALDIEELEKAKNERKDALYRDVIAKQDPETVNALERLIGDNSAFGALRYSKIDFVGLAKEFPEGIASRFEALCSSDLSDREDSSVFESSTNSGRNGVGRK